MENNNKLTIICPICRGYGFISEKMDVILKKLKSFMKYPSTTDPFEESKESEEMRKWIWEQLSDGKEEWFPFN